MTSEVAIRPAFTTIEGWMQLSGMGRRAVYDSLGNGELKAVKRGTRTLVDVDAGLAWLRSLPPAKIKGPKHKKPEAPDARASS